MERQTIDRFKKSLLAFDKLKSTTIARQVVDEDKDISAFYHLVQIVLAEIGEEWSRGDISLAQEYMAASICEQILDSFLHQGDQPASDTNAVALTTLDDFHLLGKKIVSSIIRSAGITITEYKPTGNTTRLAELIIENQNKVVLVSALMLHTAYRISELRTILQSKNYDVKIIAGGAPFNHDDQLWQQVGADAMGTSPTDALPFINQWKGGQW